MTEPAAKHLTRSVVAPDHPCLPGHFPGQPVVPAVVLLDHAARALDAALGRRVRLSAVPAVKFLSPLLPGQAFSIELQLDLAARSARFRAQGPDAELAQGRLEWTDEA